LIQLEPSPGGSPPDSTSSISATCGRNPPPASIIERTVLALPDHFGRT
jgi:hypothetical protein